MQADDEQDTLTLLRKFDKLIISKSATVADLIDQAIVASEIADEPSETWTDSGPLERMYRDLQMLFSEVNKIQADARWKNNSYENVTWTDNTSGTWSDPRYALSDQIWSQINKTAIKTSSGTGT
jgi:hypothetical protein